MTNPKTIVFLVAALPQFVNFEAGSVPLQMMILGLVFTIVAFVCDSIWALIAGAARQWFARSPQRLAAVRATGGGMLVGLGGGLILDRRLASGADVVGRGRPNQATAAVTSATTCFSTAGLHFVTAYDTGHMSPSSRFALSWKPMVEYLVPNLPASWKKTTALPFASA